MTYIPYGGGGQVATQLVGKHVDGTVNNPIEAESHWRAGKLRALCVMDKERLPYKAKVTATQSWNDLPTCASAGIPVEYTMLRGIFMAPGVTPEQQQFYVDLMARVRKLPEWAEFMDKGAFKQLSLSGKEYFDWLGQAEQMHRVLMRDAGFLAH
jgi:putative tricarboxylic transport membrane protein